VVRGDEGERCADAERVDHGPVQRGYGRHVTQPDDAGWQGELVETRKGEATMSLITITFGDLTFKAFDAQPPTVDAPIGEAPTVRHRFLVELDADLNSLGAILKARNRRGTYPLCVNGGVIEEELACIVETEFTGGAASRWIAAVTFQRVLKIRRLAVTDEPSDVLAEIRTALAIACEQDPGLASLPDEPAVMVRQLVQRNAQLLKLLADWNRLATSGVTIR
jgi:hypothetical protein